MLRLVLGSTVSASALLATQVRVAHAAEQQPEKTFAPVYDDEVAHYDEIVLGTAAEATAADPRAQQAAAAPAAGRAAQNAAETATRRLDGALGDAQSRIEQYVDQAQTRVRLATKAAREFADEKRSKWGSAARAYGETFRQRERETAQTIASLQGEGEQMLPNAIYVLVAGLGASIFARRRNFVVRAVAPWAVGAAAFGYLLPKTFANTRALAWRYEQEQLPTVAKKHERAYEKAAALQSSSVETYEKSEKRVAEATSKARSWIREWTGL